MKKIGVLVSGNGSNLQALLEACKKENWDAEFAVVISNKPAVYALERAALFDVTTMYLSEEGK
ncbi:MAG: formyltransferase family protein, partial [bacterium]